MDIHAVLRSELNKWLKGVGAASPSGYLYYLESSPDQKGDLVIRSDMPEGYRLVMPEKINHSQSVEENFNRICTSNRLERMHILDHPKYHDSDEDYIVWCDGTVCYREDLEAFSTYMSDDYRIVYFGTVEHQEITDPEIGAENTVDRLNIGIDPF